MNNVFEVLGLLPPKALLSGDEAIALVRRFRACTNEQREYTFRGYYKERYGYFGIVLVVDVTIPSLILDFTVQTYIVCAGRGPETVRLIPALHRFSVMESYQRMGDIEVLALMNLG